jgi:hypothetical protein
MQSKYNKNNNSKQPYKRRDDRLLLLQKSLTDKINKTTDQGLIKFYLQQIQKISLQLSLRDGVK